MLFNSFEFLVFLPIVFLLYWYVFKTRKWQNLLIVVSSYIFYGWWNCTFLILIAFTSFCSFLCGLAIQHDIENNASHKGRFATLNACINLLILCVYKYYNFFADSLVEAFSVFHVNLHPITLNLILPVGISFYTFQALSYTIDVYRGKIQATKDIVSFFAFLSFFPQLVAGPIERATNLLPQFQNKRVFDYTFAVEGCRQMLWGFFKKIVIADNCAYYADIAFNNTSECGSVSLILGALFFTFQIYGDFSGYSSIAIGCSKLFGISLCANFRVPYFSRDIAEFWRRWHISLNKWFVDYVYIPLGGSRVSKQKVIRNIFVIFLLSGLWHGANWTYVLWGGYHACLFLPLILLGNNHRYTGGFSDNLLPKKSEVFGMITTFALVCMGWIIFRADSMSSFVEYIKGIFSLRPNGSSWVSISDSLWLVITVLVMLIIEWFNRNSVYELEVVPKNKICRHLMYVLLIGSTFMAYMMSIQDDNTFIYFQF